LNNKVPYLAANLIAPGVGQLLARKWISGIPMLAIGVFSALWFSWEVLYPWYMIIQNALNDQEINLHLFNYRNLVISPALLIAVWILSYVDLFTMKEKDK